VRVGGFVGSGAAHGGRTGGGSSAVCSPRQPAAAHPWRWPLQLRVRPVRPSSAGAVRTDTRQSPDASGGGALQPRAASSASSGGAEVRRRRRWRSAQCSAWRPMLMDGGSGAWGGAAHVHALRSIRGGHATAAWVAGSRTHVLRAWSGDSGCSREWGTLSTHVVYSRHSRWSLRARLRWSRRAPLRTQRRRTSSW
jgi:hypothetical protein